MVQMNDFSRQEVDAEVVGGRAALAATCGIPEADIVGFRTPYLQSRPRLRSVRCLLACLLVMLQGRLFAKHEQ
jgi:hypothetical protein